MVLAEGFSLQPKMLKDAPPTTTSYQLTQNVQNVQIDFLQ